MRKTQALAILAALAAASPMAAPGADPPFDACAVFTQDDASKALGTAASPEPVNPKARRPRAILQCTYVGSKEGKPVSATVQFRFARSSEASAREFDDLRLKIQTKPMLISGAEAFWAGKAGEMYLRKDRIWVVMAVGPEKVNERELDQARKLAEIMAGKL